VEAEKRRAEQLGAVAADVDASYVEIAADSTEDGVYYHQETTADTFVGRTTEREQWTDVLDEVRETGSGSVAVLTGPGESRISHSGTRSRRSIGTWIRSPPRRPRNQNLSLVAITRRTIGWWVSDPYWSDERRVQSPT